MRLNDKSNKSRTKKKLQMKRFSINYSRTVFHVFSCWNHVDLRSFPLKTKNYWKPFWIADILCLSRRPCWVELCLSSLASCAWFQSAGPQQQPSSSTTTRWWSRPWREKWDHQSTSAGPPPCCSCWAVLWSASSAGRRREPHLLTTPTCRTAQTFSSATLRPAWPVWDLMPWDQTTPGCLIVNHQGRRSSTSPKCMITPPRVKARVGVGCIISLRGRHRENLDSNPSNTSGTPDKRRAYSQMWCMMFPAELQQSRVMMIISGSKSGWVGLHG